LCSDTADTKKVIAGKTKSIISVYPIFIANLANLLSLGKVLLVLITVIDVT